MAHTRLIVSVFVAMILSAGIAFSGTVTEPQVIDIVTRTSGDISQDAQGTFDKVIRGEHPYKDKDNSAIYVFVYDSGVNIVAHPKKALVGRCYKGKPDVRGKKFRDEIVEGAIKNTTGWVTYSYQKPKAKGIHQKKTYYKLTNGNDGKQYVVCCGMYSD